VPPATSAHPTVTYSELPRNAAPAGTASNTYRRTRLRVSAHAATEPGRGHWCVLSTACIESDSPPGAFIPEARSQSLADKGEAIKRAGEELPCPLNRLVKLAFNRSSQNVASS
jgi:hypothetical protein